MPDQISSDFGDLRDRVGNLEKGLAENTATTKRIESNTSELIDAFDSLKSAFKVLNWIGRAAKPIGYITAAVAGAISIYTAIKSGVGIK
jgi:hypothetical protein